MNNVNALLRGEGHVCFYSEFNVILCMETKRLPWHSSSSNPYLCCLSPLHLSQSLFQGSHVIGIFPLSGPQCCVWGNAVKTKFLIFAYFQDTELMSNVWTGTQLRVL